MPADTNSTLLQLLLMGTGNDNNAWGDNVNTLVLPLIENAIAGKSALAITGGSHNLTDDEARPMVMFLTGVLASDQTLVCANRTKVWKIFNNTTGNFYVLFKTAGGTAINIPRGKVTEVFCDGSNGCYRGDRERVGNLFYHAGTTAPFGALECDGSSLLRASLVDLFTALGTTWGAADGTHFSIPNGTDTNRFLRARSGGLAIGTYQVNAFGSHAHSATGSTTVNAVGDHSHANSLNDPSHNHGVSGGVWGGTSAGVLASGAFSAPFSAAAVTINGSFTGMSINNANAGAHNHTATTTVTVNANGSSETRPESIVSMLCVWY